MPAGTALCLLGSWGVRLIVMSSSRDNSMFVFNVSRGDTRSMSAAQDINDSGVGLEDNICQINSGWRALLRA